MKESVKSLAEAGQNVPLTAFQMMKSKLNIVELNSLELAVQSETNSREYLLMQDKKM